LRADSLEDPEDVAPIDLLAHPLRRHRARRPRPLWCPQRLSGQYDRKPNKKSSRPSYEA